MSMDHGFIIWELFSLVIVSGAHGCLQFPLSTIFEKPISKKGLLRGVSVLGASIEKRRDIVAMSRRLF